MRHKISFSNNFISHLSTAFNADSLTNKMELEKLDSFLINNQNVTETALIKLIITTKSLRCRVVRGQQMKTGYASKAALALTTLNIHTG